ncbi:MAG: hypothetical protein EA398_07260 [Deltaproteobacteria bacterium]|nr:MAG: hypothetical protein EA398_07260 [Deltaproteobacteria bacterium]
MQEERAIDLDEEMDLLFACAVEAVEREVGVSQASVRLRRVRGEWQMEGQGEAEQRRQVLMTVVLDPARGPGVIAQHVRQERDVEGVRGGEGGAASDEGWRRRSVTSEDRQLEQALVGQTQACWQANSRHGDTGRRRAR